MSFVVGARMSGIEGVLSLIFAAYAAVVGLLVVAFGCEKLADGERARPPTART
ncbi:MAG: hypothetical protein ACRDZX_17650 [Acidimicrobiales bacterium]